MTIQDIIDIQNFISEIKLKKLTSKTRIALVKNYGELKKTIENFNNTIKTYREFIFKDLNDLTTEVQALRLRFNIAKTEKERDEINKESLKYQNYFNAENEYQKLYNEELQKEIDIELELIDKDEILNYLMEEKEDFTVKDIGILSPMLKNIN